MQIWRLLISINCISSTKETNPITRKSMSNGRHLKNPKIRDKCMAVRHGMPYLHKVYGSSGTNQNSCQAIVHKVRFTHCVIILWCILAYSSELFHTEMTFQRTNTSENYQTGQQFFSLKSKAELKHAKQQFSRLHMKYTVI